MLKSRIMIGLIVVAAGTAVLAMAAPLPHFFEYLYAESDFGGSLHEVHWKPIELDITHHAKGGTFWAINTDFIEDSGWNDWLTIKGSYQHLVAPHGEPTNPKPINYEMFLNADNYPSGKVVMPNFSTVVFHPPTNHGDDLFATLTAKTEHAGAGSDQITSYVFRCWVQHESAPTDHRWGGVDRSQKCDDEQSGAYGCVDLLLNRASNTVSLNTLISGILLTDFSSACLRSGPYGSEGPVILDLGPVSNWQDVYGQGIALEVIDAAVPPEFVSDILAGDSYLEIATASFPDGEIRGQLTPEPISVKPLDIGLRHGKWIAGRVQEVQKGDDRDFVVQPRPSYYSTTRFAEVDVIGQTSVDDAILFKFDLQSSTDGVEACTQQKIQLANWKTGDFEVVDVHTTTASDHVVRFETYSDPNRFIEGSSGYLYARISWEVLTPDPQPALYVQVDQVRWEITPRGQ